MPVSVIQYDDALALTTAPDDGHRWECYKDLSAEEVTTKIQECKDRKWRPSIVHRHRRPEDKYLLVLIDEPHDKKWEYSTDLSREDYEAKLIENRKRGFRPAHMQSWLVDEAPVYTVVRVGNAQNEQVATPAK